MSLTLGEKLRQAREERGFTISEVAEQTRISSLYLESIENDDYRILPGGIFNKGFVKSYAKFVGINEAEALSDYAGLLAKTDSEDGELKVYKPEVLTDDRSGSSMAPTIILAVVILGIMTAGILFLVDYMRRPVEPPIANIGPKPPAANGSPEAVPESTPASTDSPQMATLKVEFKALNQPVRLVSTTDGTKTDSLVAAGSSATFEPKESLILNYNRWNAPAVQLTINGKAITLPATPLKGATDKGRIEFSINKDNLAQIWTSGAISTEVSSVPTDANTNANVTAPPVTAATSSTQPKPTPAPTNTSTTANKPATNTNTATKPTPAAKPVKTPAPSTPAPKPPANNDR